ncbi:hypothetical protein [Candidatus Venteria ishoeyi]|uniref:DUF4178 domain-containing protein n=1 Tax=Candidatus Venteria ishoeyi TaxID=1899563 RepID=A0A1H6F8J8_9GAMM|nr:hypothetical protein [Candidatus Venteria ishoeyi]MDM8547035.1 hypothetical protein [Candidatus Venteria ishoeyi]SEH06442.1 Uncharacterised protein [Candidatus Venteria ishoeyi]
MANLVTLSCPTCGAAIRVAGNVNSLDCEHCHNHFILENQVQKIPAAEQDKLRPLVTYTHQLGQWLRVGDYEICVHEIFEEKIKNQWMVYANVEYRNQVQTTLSCRVGQWIMFDTENYSYDGVSQSQFFEDKGRPRLSERIIAPRTGVRGWLAFKKPLQAEMERLQFLTGYMSEHTVNFMLKAESTG